MYKAVIALGIKNSYCIVSCNFEEQMLNPLPLDPVNIFGELPKEPGVYEFEGISLTSGKFKKIVNHCYL